MITIFTLMNSFIRFFHKTFYGFKTPVEERWLIHMKRMVAVMALLVFLLVLFMIDSTIVQIEIVTKSLGGYL